jgi:hypothetical protein
MTIIVLKVERWDKQYFDEHRVGIYAFDADAFPKGRRWGDLLLSFGTLRELRGWLDELAPVLAQRGYEVQWQGEPIVGEPPPATLKRALRALRALL